MHEYGSDKICLIQRRQSCSESEQLSNNEHWTIDNDNPKIPNIAPAPQIWFRHTMLLTPKLAKTLNHANSGPQASFAFATWRLGTPSRILKFATLDFEGEDTQNWNMLEVPPHGISTKG